MLVVTLCRQTPSSLISRASPWCISWLTALVLVAANTVGAGTQRFHQDGSFCLDDLALRMRADEAGLTANETVGLIETRACVPEHGIAAAPLQASIHNGVSYESNDMLHAVFGPSERSVFANLDHTSPRATLSIRTNISRCKLTAKEHVFNVHEGSTGLCVEYSVLHSLSPLCSLCHIVRLPNPSAF